MSIFKRAKKISVNPQQAALIVIDQAMYLTSKIREDDVRLTDKQTLQVTNEILKAELALAGISIGNHIDEEAMADTFYTKMIEEIGKEISINTDFAALSTLVGKPSTKWIADLHDYYVGEKLSKEAEKWVASKFWSDSEDRNLSDIPSLRIALRLHFRIYKVMGITSVENAGKGGIHTYLSLAYHCPESIKLWSDVTFSVK